MRILLILLGWLWVAPAWSHAVLITVSPGDGSTLATSPAAYTLNFNEPVTPLSLGLTGPDGQAIVLPPVRGDGAEVRQPLPPDLPAGAYLMQWQVRSGDGHTIRGASSFGLRVTPDAVGRSLSPPAWERIAAMVLLLPPALLALGAGLLPRGLEPPGRRHTAAVSLGLLIPAALILGEVPPDWRSLALPAGLMLLCLAPRPAALTGAVLTALALGSDGHPGKEIGTLLLGPLHVAIAGYWLAGVVSLIRQPERAAAFGRGALWLVPLLPVSGIILALLLTGGPAEVSPAYFYLLITKACGMVGLSGLAALNRWRLVPRGSPRLSLSLKIEAGLLLAVILTAAGMQATPPRQPPNPPILYHLHGGGLHGEASLAPSGDLTLLLLTEDTGGVAKVSQVTVELTDLSRPATRQPDGIWVARFGLLPPGKHSLTATILVDDFTRIKFRAEP